MKRFVIVLGAATLFLTGCQGFHRERSVDAVDILGVGWISEGAGTNRLRIFGLGSVKKVRLKASPITNAPYSLQNAPRSVETPSRGPD